MSKILSWNTLSRGKLNTNETEKHKIMTIMVMNMEDMKKEEYSKCFEWGF